MTDQPTREQAKAIREQHDERPAVPTETPREARWRVERERAARDLKSNPHKGY